MVYSAGSFWRPISCRRRHALASSPCVRGGAYAHDRHATTCMAIVGGSTCSIAFGREADGESASRGRQAFGTECEARSASLSIGSALRGHHRTSFPLRAVGVRLPKWRNGSCMHICFLSPAQSHSSADSRFDRVPQCRYEKLLARIFARHVIHVLPKLAQH